MNEQEYIESYLEGWQPKDAPRPDNTNINKLLFSLSDCVYSDQAETALECMSQRDIVNFLQSFSQSLGLADKVSRLTSTNLTEWARENDRKINELRQFVQAKDDQLADKLQQIEDYKRQLIERDDQAGATRQQLGEQDKTIAGQNQQLQEQDQQILDLNRQMSSQDKQIVELNKHITALEQQRERVERDQRLVDLNSRLQELGAHLKGRDEQLVAIGQRLADRDKTHVDELEKQLSGRNQQLAERDRMLREATEQIEQYRKHLDDAMQEINRHAAKQREAKQILERHETEISRIHDEWQLTQTKLDQAEKTIDELFGSRSWKITAPIRKLSTSGRSVANYTRRIAARSDAQDSLRKPAFGPIRRSIWSNWIGMQQRRASILKGLYRQYIRDSGGIVSGTGRLGTKVISALSAGGVSELRYRIRRYAFRTTSDEHFTEDEAVLLGRKTEIRGFSVAQHESTVDIIVCVHNALDDVKRCLASILRFTFPPYSLILVDDGSDTDTREYLEAFSRSQKIRLLRNDSAKGYTVAANQGLRTSDSAYVVLLNSDTIVSHNWLDRMMMCAESDEGIGMVGPLSNTASWQSIPQIEEGEDWAENPLPEGYAVEDMGNLVARWSGRIYPLIPFLNGFCMLIKRSVIDQLGYFDEAAFPEGYGEENDYCVRARKAGWNLALADDAYVYHAQSKSYSHARRKSLSQKAANVLVRKHGSDEIDSGVSQCRNDRVLRGMRVRAQAQMDRQHLIEEARFQWEGKRLVFVLPILEAGGGGNVVISEIIAMRKMGVDARILNLTRHRAAFQKSYPGLDVPVIYAPSEQVIPEMCQQFDAVVATVNTTVPQLAPLAKRADHPVIGYYVQDFEPYFYPEGSQEYFAAWESYSLIKSMKCFTKTQWNQNEVLDQTGVNCGLIGPSCEVDLFRPRVRTEASWPTRPLRIAAMIRPSAPRRNGYGTMAVLRDLCGLHGDNIEVILFGVASDDPEFRALPNDFKWRNLGVRTSTELALVFNEVDIFVDFSTFQAMGLTAMEAMATGAAVIVPKMGGAGSFAVDDHNALVVDSSSHTECVNALQKLILDKNLRARLQRQAIADMSRFYPERPAYNLLQVLFGKSSDTLSV